MEDAGNEPQFPAEIVEIDVEEARRQVVRAMLDNEIERQVDPPLAELPYRLRG